MFYIIKDDNIHKSKEHMHIHNHRVTTLEETENKSKKIDVNLSQNCFNTRCLIRTYLPFEGLIIKRPCFNFWVLPVQKLT